MMASLPLAQTLAALPPEWQEDLLPSIRHSLQAGGRRLIVLDDDPTGTQTVHDVPVLTQWSAAALLREFSAGTPFFYILTNSRGLPEAGACRLSENLARNLEAAAQKTGASYDIISRSDSTLRGHFPAELHALETALQTRFDAWLIVPFFLEGGRYTIADIHYVDSAGMLVPAGETEFARDRTFGYSCSNLREWVAEKTGGAIPAAQVASISSAELRLGGPEVVLERLMNLPKGCVCVVNAAAYRDLEVLVAAIRAAGQQGRRFLFRSAASLVRVMAGQRASGLLSAESLDLPRKTGALVVVGSYVPRSTVQLETLVQQAAMVQLELDVEALLDETRANPEINRAVAAIDRSLAAGQDVVTFTSRRLMAGADPLESLQIGQRVSAGLVQVVERLSVCPRYLLAKGGITSSDLATRALKVERAMVLGQILPGVPVWRLGPETRFPGLTYIVFPGNVGAPDALAAIVHQL